MTTINTNNSDAYSALGLNVPQSQKSKSLGQADFLRLMTEQLKNQDPLKPLDNNQFLGQLAQFSTVQGIDKMQNAMEAVASVMRLFEDNKARDVGDLLTVVLVESTRAKTNAKTAVTKEAGIDISAPTIFGQNVTLNGNPVLQAQIEGSRNFAGNGDSAQSNQLAGTITVSVVENLGNGHLRVAGEKRVRLNQGDELVQVQGIVRVADIGPDNRIGSDRIGEARIVYGGNGTLARSNAMGWLGRFFNSAAFPY